MTPFRLESVPLGVGPLVRDALAGGPAAAWYAPVPRRADGWRSAVAAARARVADDWRAALGDALHATSAAEERLRRAAADGVVVTTGQQPGLFGGPALVWHKALSALALADAIERATGTPCAPVFWAATDDTDFVEAAATWVASGRGGERLALTGRPADDTPLSLARLGSEVTALRAALDRHLGSVPWPDAIARGLAAYAPDATHGEAFVALLREALGPVGVSVLDAAHPAVGDGTRPFLARALQAAGSINQALVRRAEEIAAAGFALQVPLRSELSLVFAWRDGAKRRVPVAQAGAVAHGAVRLSPNVLLRPIAEAAVLPSVAYIAGPGELAYFAQVSAVAQALGSPVPVAVPRWSGRVVERRHEDQLAAWGATLEDLRDPHALANRVARAAIPAAEAAAVGSLRDAVRAAAEALNGSHATLPPQVVAGMRRAMEWRVDRLERRLAAAVKRRDDVTQRLVATLQGHYWPQGAPQERRLNPLPWFARFAPDLLAALRDATRAHAAALLGGSTP